MKNIKHNISSLDHALKLHKQGQLFEAKVLYCELLKFQNTPQINYLLGILYNQEKEYLKAVKHLELSAHANKLNPDWFNALALSYQKLNKINVAKRLIQIAVSLNSKNPNYINRYAKILIDNQEASVAINIINMHIAHLQDFAPIHVTLAYAWKVMGKPFKTAKILLTAIRLFPQHPQVLFNSIDILVFLGRYNYANTLINGLIQHKPTMAECLSQLSIINKEMGNFNDAIKLLEQALTISPNNPVIQWNHSLLLLLLGEHNDGWKKYDYSISAGQRKYPVSNIPIWKGENLAEKSLLLINEQGLGDQIMFASQFNNITYQAKKITLACEPRLEELFRLSFPTLNIVSSQSINQKIVGDYDYMVLAASIYPILHAKNIVCGAKKQYIFPEKTVDSILKTNNGILKVGISWKGGTSLKDQRKRSIRLFNWKNILSNNPVQFVCLQHNLDENEKQFIQGQENINHIESIDSNQDIVQLTSLISELDLVISVDNTITHIAGSLGIETWCLIPFSPDWRWGLDSTSNAWYQSVELIRQSRLHNWDHELKIVEQKLHSLLP